MDWRALPDAASDLVLGSCCAGCSRRGRALCDRCAELLCAPAAPRWPDPVPKGLPPPFAVADYEGAVRAVLLAHKEHARYGLARPLGGAVASAVAAAVEATAAAPAQCRPLGLVPPPSRGAVVRMRGHDPVSRMAHFAAAVLRRCGQPCVVLPVLRAVRVLSDQADLGAAQRGRNLAGAYRVSSRRAVQLRGVAAIVVVDDVITTGATAAEAARAIASVGGDVVGVAVVAATRRRLPGTRRADVSLQPTSVDPWCPPGSVVASVGPASNASPIG